MAINRSTFMGERTNSSSGSTRVMSARDSGNLVKTVNAINLNLISINKMLQQQYTVETRTKLQQQRKRNIEAENLRRETAETASETAQNIGGFVSKALIQPSKKIISSIFNLAGGFIKFFTLTFVGWFTKSVAAWFEQDKSTREKQVKTWAKKITTAIAIAGGVLLAVKIGIPVVMTLLSAVVSMTVKSVALLLNPLTWKLLLIGGLGALAFEGVNRAVDELNPARKAERRTRSILEDNDRRTLQAALASTNSRELRDVGGGQMTDMTRVSSDQLVPTSQIPNLLSDTGTVDFYREINGKLSKQGNFLITRTSLENNEFFKKDQNLRETILNARYRPAFTEAVGEAYKAKRDLDAAIRDNKSSTEIANQRKVYEDLLGKAQTLYDKLSLSAKASLTSSGITRKTLGSADIFEQGPLEFALGKIGRDIINSPLISSISGMSDKFQKELDSFNKRIEDALLINVNNNIIEEQFTMDENPGEIPGLGSISPFDLTNPWIFEAMKTYELTSA